MSKSFFEPQYDFLNETPEIKLGLMSAGTWYKDPKRFAFVLARYKFVAKMLAGKSHVLEVGCGDAFASRIVQQDVEQLTVLDVDETFIQDIEQRSCERWPLKAVCHNILDGALPANYDAAYSLDVFEHIDPELEHVYLQNLRSSLTENGVAIIGIPSLESQKYASPESIEGHVNCKSGLDFKKVCEKHFKHVFLFSMNDEVVHTGFYPMAHYLLALCIK